MPSLNPIGTPFIELHSIDSTNNYAMGLVHAGMALHGMAVFAHEQLKGKGQRNKVWNSEKGRNIALSLVLEPAGLSPRSPFYLSMAMANAVRAFLERYLPEGVSIKWPNDIYWRDRKAAGILIENIWKGGEWKFAIAGIGININQTQFGVLQSTAVSLKQASGKEYPPLELAKELCKDVDLHFQQVLSAPENIAREYRAHIYRKDQPVRFRKGSRVFEAVVRDVSTDGCLVVQHSTEEQFKVGEVEWII